MINIGLEHRDHQLEGLKKYILSGKRWKIADPDPYCQQTANGSIRLHGVSMMHQGIFIFILLKSISFFRNRRIYSEKWML